MYNKAQTDNDSVDHHLNQSSVSPAQKGSKSMKSEMNMKKKLNKLIDINNSKSSKNTNTNAYSKVQFSVTNNSAEKGKSADPKKAKRTIKYYNPK